MYFARPDSRLYGREVHSARRRMGELLAAQAPVDADLVMGVPESGVPAAEGYARASGIPHGQGLVKNRYIGRTFITPGQDARDDGVRRKLNPLRENIEGKAHRRRRRLHRARHDPARRGADAARSRSPRGAPADLVVRRWRGPASTASTSPTATSSSRPSTTVPEIAEVPRTSTRSRICRSTISWPPSTRPAPGFCSACLTGNYPAPVPVELAAAVDRRIRVRPPRPPPEVTGSPADGSRGATYASAGVDIAAGDTAVARIRGTGGLDGAARGARRHRRFRRVLRLRPRPATRTRCWWRPPTGWGRRRSWPRDAGRYDTIGIDLVAMCVDDLVCVGAEPLFLLDYVVTGKLDPDQMEALVSGVADGCRQAGCALLGGEMAEHPGSMAPGRVRPGRFRRGGGRARRHARRRRGWPSATCWWAWRRPGLRSNGYSLARHVLLERAGLALDDPAWTGAGHTLADELLRPSVVYAPAVLAAVAAAERARGGPHHRRGLPGNLDRVLPPDATPWWSADAWTPPPIFAEIQRLGDVDDDEMARVFNLGIGMVLVVGARRRGRRAGGAHRCRRRGRGGGAGGGRTRPGADDRGPVTGAGGPDVGAPDVDPGLRALRDHVLEHSVQTGDFVLKSGRRSTWFIDSKQTVCRPGGMLLVADADARRRPRRRHRHRRTDHGGRSRGLRDRRGGRHPRAAR